MVVSRTCKALKDNGEPCRAAPLHEGAYCVFHDPEHAEVVQEARRAGGQRRKREVAVAAAVSERLLLLCERVAPRPRQLPEPTEEMLAQMHDRVEAAFGHFNLRVTRP